MCTDYGLLIYHDRTADTFVLLVQVVRAAVARADYRGDAFPLLKRQQPEWTRDRWDRAAAELDGHQRLGI